MFEPNEYLHRRFLILELRRILGDEGFAAKLWRNIGQELHYRLVEYEDESETELSRIAPVECLFFWVEKDGGLDPEWLASDDDSYLDDEGQLIARDVQPVYSGAEQVAAYGLWLASVLIDSLGKPSECAENEQGWSREAVLGHRAECLLFAYQALVYAQRMAAGGQLTEAEQRAANRFNFAQLGAIGAAKRHMPMKKLRDWTVEQYRAGKWPSANKAAHDLKDSVMAYGRKVGANLTAENAQRTIAQWIRESPSRG